MDISDKIKNFLRDLRGTKLFELTFSYNEITYTTIFRATHSFIGEEEAIEVDNGCVNLSFGFTLNEKGKNVFYRDFVGGIQAEDGILGWIELDREKSCFYPKLTTDPRDKKGKRTTSGDVLQTLKTKLALSFPKKAPVRLIDGIRTESSNKNGSPTMTSPFHLVRGGNAHYERFGYHSTEINKLKKGIKKFKWEQCTPDIKKIIQDCTKKEYANNDLLTDIMLEISWEDEVSYNETHKSSLSSTVFREYALIKGIPMEQSHQWSFHNIWTFELDTASPEWKTYNSELIFTSFIPIASLDSKVKTQNAGTQRKSKRQKGKRGTRRKRD